MENLPEKLPKHYVVTDEHGPAKPERGKLVRRNFFEVIKAVPLADERSSTPEVEKDGNCDQSEPAGMFRAPPTDAFGGCAWRT